MARAISSIARSISAKARALAAICRSVNVTAHCPKELRSRSYRWLWTEIAIVVNRTNPVVGPGLVQVQSVFTGKVRNWRELHGENREIRMLVDRQASGRNAIFRARCRRDAPGGVAEGDPSSGLEGNRAAVGSNDDARLGEKR
ncbi:MAG: hypothetical protein GEV13_14625 [Rhodospirillales bacterium]|nr:hypothetical protein [Rhodospirillales bacterium]